MKNNIRRQNAFTLVEVLVAVLVVGLAVASLLGANITFTKANAVGTEMSTAEFLMEQIRELTVVLPVLDPETVTPYFGPEMTEGLATYDDIDDFDGLTFSPPIDSKRQTINDLVGYSQSVMVESVNPANFEQVVSDYSSDFVRVTVKVSFNSKEISSASWIRTNLAD